jgi:Tfp pilus assembly protein FimV
MGDVALKSHLGEPLVAGINVTDVEKSPDTNCFSVTDTSDVPAFKKAFISLKPINDGYQLTINTHDVITEPIVNLHVTYHCDPNFNRDYVLLLDPATLTDDAVSFESTALTEKKTNNSNKLSSAISNQSTIQKNSDVSNMPAKETTAKKKTTKKKSPAAISIDEKLMEAYTGKKQSASKPMTDAVTENNPTKKTDTASVSSKPLLTISGGDVKPNEKTSLPNLALRLETQIDFCESRAASAIECNRCYG